RVGDVSTASEGRARDTTRLGMSPWKAFTVDAEDYFDKDEIARCRRYVKPLRVANALRVVVNVVVDLAVIRTHAMPNLLHRLDLNNWVLEVFVVAAALLVIGLVVNTGFSWWQSMVYDKKWEFSTMTAATFFGDLAKSIGLGLVLNGIV